jgi:protein-tyrosine phosphatase
MIQVSPFLWRGPRPKTLEALADRGFKRVINFQSGSQDSLSEDRYELQCRSAYAFGVEVVKIKCSNIFPPTVAQVAHFLDLTDANSPETYVHCHSGVDRTGFMCAVFRMREQGWSFDAAYDEWVKLGRHWWFWWWTRELRKWARK